MQQQRGARRAHAEGDRQGNAAGDADVREWRHGGAAAGAEGRALRGGDDAGEGVHAGDRGGEEGRERGAARGGRAAHCDRVFGEGTDGVERSDARVSVRNQGEK